MNAAALASTTAERHMIERQSLMTYIIPNREDRHSPG
jgi:hypothetical protein